MIIIFFERSQICPRNEHGLVNKLKHVPNGTKKKQLGALWLRSKPKSIKLYTSRHKYHLDFQKKSRSPEAYSIPASYFEASNPVKQ
jgi:hypothetical protein